MLICQITDLHMRPGGLAVSRVSETNMFAERAFRVVAALTPAPDLILLTGDLVEAGLADEYRNLLAALNRTLRRPVHVIPGNHDDRQTMRVELAHLPGMAAHPDFIQYAIEDHPVRVIMLDTLVPGRSHGELGPQRLAWLDATLAEQPDRPALLAMHHPPIMTGIPHMDRIGLVDAGAFAALVARHPQVERIVCGHYHRPIVGRCAQAIVSVAPSVAHQVEWTFDPLREGALTFEPPAFQLHWWQPGQGFVSHTLYTDTYPGPFPFLPP